jgi:hypothetical protein
MPTEYSELMSLFLDLRGKGLSLSSIDFDILQSWQKNNISPELIAKIMFEIKEECINKNKNYPNNFEPISRKLNKILLKMRES